MPFLLAGLLAVGTAFGVPESVANFPPDNVGGDEVGREASTEVIPKAGDPPLLDDKPVVGYEDSPEYRETKAHESSVQNSLADIVDDLDCEDIEGISEWLTPVSSAISDWYAAKFKNKDTTGPKKKIINTITDLIDIMDTTCDVITSVDENNGNAAIVIKRRASDLPRDSDLEAFSIRFSQESFELLHSVDSTLWPMLISKLKKRNDAGIGVPLYMPENIALTVVWQGRTVYHSDPLCDAQDKSHEESRIAAAKPHEPVLRICRNVKLV